MSFYLNQMKYISLFTLLLIFACTPQIKSVKPINVIPLPNQITKGKGNLIIRKTVSIHLNNPELMYVAELFKQQMEEVLPVTLTDNVKADIQLVLTPGNMSKQSYSLNISKNQVKLTANTSQGIFYGLQTLRQLILFGQNNGNTITLPVVVINDSPRFGWRGIMLDESRHFFGKEKVKQMLDLMALHKLNIFHWHLTDVPGWRIEIKQYPKLTTIGGQGNNSNPDAPAQFYTQDDVREIVQYAADRFIEIVPEIDMPGHAAAANRAYPEFSGGGSERYPDFTFNPGKKGTYSYLTNILREIAELFPSKYIHLGGDEVHFGNAQWKIDPGVQELMTDKQLPDLKAVESYFIHRMADSVKAMGKTVVGWDEIVDHGLEQENSLVMWWRHNMPEKLDTALLENYNVILCPRIPLYFDFVQNESHKYGRKWGGAFASLDFVYAFPPDSLPGFTQHYNQVGGLQANLWTERIQNNYRLDYMLNPRLSAMAEAAWTEMKNKNYNDFLNRLKPILLYLKKQDIGFYNPFEPESTPEPIGAE